MLGVPTDGTAPIDRLVAASRSNGMQVPEDRRVAAAQRALEHHTVEQVDLEAARKRLADAGPNVVQLRENVATARGRLEARRETNAATDAAEEDWRTRRRDARQAVLTEVVDEFF